MGFTAKPRSASSKAPWSSPNSNAAKALAACQMARAERGAGEADGAVDSALPGSNAELKVALAALAPGQACAPDSSCGALPCAGFLTPSWSFRRPGFADQFGHMFGVAAHFFLHPSALSRRDAPRRKYPWGAHYRLHQRGAPRRRFLVWTRPFRAVRRVGAVQYRLCQRFKDENLQLTGVPHPRTLGGARLNSLFLMSPRCCPVPGAHAQCGVEPLSSELSWHQGQTW